jgi:PAS domain-containing protein
MRKYPDDIQLLTDELLANMIAYSSSNQGIIFILNDKKKLDATAYYAYGKKKYLNTQIEVGHGLLGSAFQDGKTQLITEIPKDYLNITSGLGKAAPRSLALIPLKYQDATLGIMEIASFEEYEAHHIEFFELVADILASTITNLLINAKTKHLLSEAQKNTMRIYQQENLLREQTDNLEKMKEELVAEHQKLENESGMLRHTLDFINLSIVNIDNKGIVLYLNQTAAHIFDAEPEMLLNRSLFKLLPTIQDELNYIDEHELVEKVVYQNISSGRGRIMPYQTIITKVVGGKQTIFSLNFVKQHDSILI